MAKKDREIDYINEQLTGLTKEYQELLEIKVCNCRFILRLKYREKGPGFWQTILSENFSLTHFFNFFPLVTAQNKFYANITPLRYRNFQQFQMELFAESITTPA